MQIRIQAFFLCGSVRITIRNTDKKVLDLTKNSFVKNSKQKVLVPTAYRIPQKNVVHEKKIHFARMDGTKLDKNILKTFCLPLCLKNQSCKYFFVVTGLPATVQFPNMFNCIKF